MDEIKLEAHLRDEMTKGQVNDLRRRGFIPAVVYGFGQKSIPIFVDFKNFHKAMHTELGENVIIKLNIDKNSSKSVIVKEVQKHPVKRSILHVDFYEISLTKEIEVDVPVEISGENPLVKSGEGLIEQILREVKVRCLPTNIPKNIVVDVTPFKLGDSLKVSGLNVPESVHILNDKESVVLNISAPKVIEEVAAVAPTVEEPEVIGKGKKEEEPGEIAEEKPAEAKKEAQPTKKEEKPEKK